MTDTNQAVPQTVPLNLVIDRRRQLRVKIKSLAAEANIIRAEERRCRDSLSRCVGHDAERALLASSFASLRSHRVGDVRRESRYSQLAYAMIRGRTLRKTETKTDLSKIDREKLCELLCRFGLRHMHVATNEVAAWLV